MMFLYFSQLVHNIFFLTSKKRWKDVEITFFVSRALIAFLFSLQEKLGPVVTSVLSVYPGHQVWKVKRVNLEELP